MFNESSIESSDSVETTAENSSDNADCVETVSEQKESFSNFDDSVENKESSKKTGRKGGCAEARSRSVFI